MDFINSGIIPQPEGTIRLMHYLLGIALAILLTYSGTLLASSIFSIYYNFKFKKDRELRYLYYSKDLIDLITSSKIFGFGMGVVPFMAILALFFQLLSGAGAPVFSYVVASFVLFIIAITLLHIYQHFSDLNYLFNFLKGFVHEESEDKLSREFLAYHANNQSLNTRTGLWGAAALFVSMWLLLGAITASVETAKWNWITNALALMFNPTALVKTLHFLTLSLALSSIAFLIKKFKWQDEPDFGAGDYREFASRQNLNIALIFTSVQPIFILFNLMITPKIALSPTMFALSTLALALVAILIHLLYSMRRDEKFNSIQTAFFVIIILFIFAVFKEQTAFRVSNKTQAAELAGRYEEYHAALLKEAGRGEAKVDGEEIYKARCVACHKFDEKLVGPPHKEVLPKYMNNKAALVKFILNPVKVNPAYPPMPAQGLKPNEADAVATYMIEKLGPKLKQ